MATVIEQQGQRAWGPRLDLGDKPNLFAPQQVQPYTPPAPGIDNLGITSTDTFRVFGVGEFAVDFRGFVRVARSAPSADDWNHSEVYTNLIEMRMIGESPDLGTVVVTLNHECLSTGQLWTPVEDMEADSPEKACRMAVTAYFHVPRLGKVLFNKEPLLLTIENVRAIPPSGNPGLGQIYDKLPLFDRDDPEGRPLADITALKFVMGAYLTEDELAAFRGSN
ncbi:MAG TPA: DUF6073 family protein [Longimicrobium sp.]|jgi:hypothetical protein